MGLVPIDFEPVTLTDGLSDAGLECSVPTLLSLLGLGQYLTDAALDLMLDFVLSMPASRELVLSFILPEQAPRRAEPPRARAVCRGRVRPGVPAPDYDVLYGVLEVRAATFGGRG